MPAGKSQVSVLRCEDYSLDGVYQVVKRSFDNLGALGRFVKPGQRVLLNPNLLCARGPERANTTHPVVVIAVSRQLQELGCEVFIGDSPGGIAQKVRLVWDNTQMSYAAAVVGATLVNFETSGVYERQVNGNSYSLSRPLFDFDAVISLPKLKTHALTMLTGAIKNNYGAVPGIRKSEYHRRFPKLEDFSGLLVDILSLVKPNLYLMDAVVAMEGDGPANGNPKGVGLLLASTDAVAMDAVAAKIMGLKPGEVATTEIAGRRGLGVGDLDMIDVIGERLSQVKPRSYELPRSKTWDALGGLKFGSLERYVWVRPAINETLCSNCNACVKNCPMNAILPNPAAPAIDYENCIKCLCCHELCPESAVYVQMSRLLRLRRLPRKIMRKVVRRIRREGPWR